jgi:hypothetical protein
MRRSAEQIVATYTDRKATCGQVHAAGQAIRKVYNGEWEVALPDLEENERASVSNKVLTGLDQHAQRIASVMPIIDCPPLKTGNAAQGRAKKRKDTLQAWWYLNKVPLMLRQRARHLIGYASSPVLIAPGNDGYPTWKERDPLTSYPAPGNDIVPSDTIFCFNRTLRWLDLNYPTQTRKLSRRDAWKWDDKIDVIQYVDADQLTLIALGQTDPRNMESNYQLLSQADNLAGCPLVIVPGRITLDRLQGQFDQMIGMYEMEATLWALHLHAVKRGIFGERWAVGDDVQIVTPANPYDGTVGHITGGDIKDIRADPGFQQLNSIDRLEQNQRQVGAVPAEFGGEGSGNVRTGRRGSQVMSAAVDFPIQEHQEILAASLEEENYAAIKIAKAYWGNTSKTFVIPFLREPVTYTPNTTFETEAQFVRYSYAGSDTNGLVIEGGQRIGMGTMSARSFMDNDPMIPDPDAEEDRIVLEGIRRAHLSAIQTQAADPAGPYQPQHLARLEELIYDKNLPLYKAVQKLQEEIQAEQAAAAGGQMGDQAVQPGLAMPGAPGTAEAAMPIGEPPASMGNLTSTLANLRLQQRSSPAEDASMTG